MCSSTTRPALLGVLVSGLVLGACAPDTPKSPPPKPQPQATAAEPARPPAPPQPVLSRQDIIAALEEEASRYAAGAPAAPSALAGRRFLIREAFGCGGPRPGEVVDGLASWAWTKDGKSIELTLKPAEWKTSRLFGSDAAELEAAEGVWLARPWMRSDGCPSTPTPPGDAGPASPQTAAVVAMYGKGESRLGRRGGKAYVHRIRGEGGDPPPLPVGGYALVLEGRLGAFADGQPIRCLADNPDQRPVCTAAVRLDRVAFEGAEGGLLSEWRGG